MEEPLVSGSFFMKKSANEGEKTDMKLRNSLLLLLTATIWGVAFVAQSVGMDYVGPFTFVFARNVIGGLVLLPVIAVLGKSGGPHPKQAPEERRKARKTLVIGGMCCGTALCAGSITPAVRAAVYAGSARPDSSPRATS